MPLHSVLTITGTGEFVVNRFVFNSSKIVELKLKAASESVPVPSRVEAISALLYRCATNASRSNSKVPRPMIMCQAMDLRLRIPTTILPRNTVGNLQTGIFVKNNAESDLNISETVASFRKAKEETNKMIQKNLQGEALGQYLLSVLRNIASEFRPNTDSYAMTSWCGKPFYEVDFGWGNSIWIETARTTLNKAYVLLTDSKDGEGVEAWIGLPKQDMSLFLLDQELLAYAVLNPQS